MDEMLFLELENNLWVTLIEIVIFLILILSLYILDFLFMPIQDDGGWSFA